MFKNGRKQQREGRRREERNEWRLSPKGNKGVMKDDVKKKRIPDSEIIMAKKLQQDAKYASIYVCREVYAEGMS